MSILFMNYCAGCKKSDDDTPLVKVKGSIYKIGTAHGANIWLCPNCLIKVKNGECKNFSLKCW